MDGGFYYNLHSLKGSDKTSIHPSIMWKRQINSPPTRASSKDVLHDQMDHQV